MTEQTVGEWLREKRQSLGRSQSEQADDLSLRSGRVVTRHEVSRWERGKRLPSPFWQEYYAASLAIPVDKLRESVRAERRLAEGDGVQRRQFISVMAGLALPAVSELPSRVGITDVDRLRRSTARLRRLDDILGGGDTYNVFAAEADRTAKLINQTQHADDVGRALRSLLAEQEQLAGWAAFDAGHHADARRHYRTSFAAADESGDDVLAGNALAFAAYQQSTTNGGGTDTARASVEMAVSATPRVSALLLERSAWVHATCGQAREADNALSLARDALRRDSDRPEPDWVFWVDDREIDIMSGRCWTELRRPLRAVPVLERVLAGFDDTCARDKALYSTWLVDAYLQANEIEQAAATLGRAWELANGVASVRPSQRIAELARRLQPHRSVTEVGELLDRITA